MNLVNQSWLKRMLQTGKESLGYRHDLRRGRQWYDPGKIRSLRQKSGFDDQILNPVREVNQRLLIGDFHFGVNFGLEHHAVSQSRRC